MSDASNTSTADVVKDYILREFLPGEDRTGDRQGGGGYGYQDNSHS